MSIKMNPFTYNGMKIKTLVDIKKYAPFDNEFWARAGDVGTIEKTIGEYHYVRFNGNSPQRVKISDTELVY